MGLEASVSRTQHLKGGVHAAPFAALSYPNSKQVPIYCWADGETVFQSSDEAQFRTMNSNDFLNHNGGALTTPSRRLSPRRYAGGGVARGIAMIHTIILLIIWV